MSAEKAPKSNLKKYGENVMWARKSLSLTQKEATELLGLKNYLVLQGIEKGRRRPGAALSERIRDILGVDGLCPCCGRFHYINDEGYFWLQRKYSEVLREYKKAKYED